jgi:hypothetical protein
MSTPQNVCEIFFPNLTKDRSGSLVGLTRIDEKEKVLIKP